MSVVCVLCVQLLSCVQLFATPRTAACEASLSFTVSRSLLKFMSIESVMLSNYLILCCPFSFCLQSFSAFLGFPGGSDGKESACKVGDVGLNLGLGRFPWRRKWQPPPVFFTGESYGQRSLAGYNPWVARSQTQLSD